MSNSAPPKKEFLFNLEGKDWAMVLEMLMSMIKWGFVKILSSSHFLLLIVSFVNFFKHLKLGFLNEFALCILEQKDESV